MESKGITIKVNVDTADAQKAIDDLKKSLGETTINHDEVIGKALMGYHTMSHEEPVTIKQFKDVARCILNAVSIRKENI